MAYYKGLLDEFKAFLPVTDKTPKLTLHEGNTPLIRLDRLSEKLGINWYAKYEGLNPTGSFKDRGMVMAVAKAIEEGANAIICASTGNTSAAAAAYAARAGIRCIVVIPEGKIAFGKMAQAVMFGAEIVQIEGNFDVALNVVRKVSEEMPVKLVNSVNPYRIEGQKTSSFEICNQLGDAPDVLAIPVGNAGNITAYWKGFKEFFDHKKITKLPRMHGFQASGAAPIVHNRVFENPETVATAIRIGNPASWKQAVVARDESGGHIDEVTDEQILEAYKLIASNEGVFAEPGSCASIAGVLKDVKAGKIQSGETVVSVLTGNGLKDPDTAIANANFDAKILPNDEKEIFDYIKGVVFGG